jgi:hypothetical protein
MRYRCSCLSFYTRKYKQVIKNYHKMDEIDMEPIKRRVIHVTDELCLASGIGKTETDVELLFGCFRGRQNG